MKYYKSVVLRVHFDQPHWGVHLAVGIAIFGIGRLSTRLIIYIMSDFPRINFLHFPTSNKIRRLTSMGPLSNWSNRSTVGGIQRSTLSNVGIQTRTMLAALGTETNTQLVDPGWETRAFWSALSICRCERVCRDPKLGMLDDVDNYIIVSGKVAIMKHKSWTGEVQPLLMHP